jgi:hypothetical protein
MLKGIIFFEQGGLQLIGELNSLAGIISTMKQILPDLEKQERNRVFSTMTVEEIAALIKEKESGAEK